MQILRTSYTFVALLTLSCSSDDGSPGTTPIDSMSGAGGAVAQGGSSGGDPSAGAAGVAEGGAGGGSAGTGGAEAGAGGSGGEPLECPFTTDEYFLWEGDAPGGGDVQLVEEFTERSNDPQVQDRAVSGVTKPSIFPYLAESPNGASAIVAPGGGYARMAWDKEGVDIALWLNSIGVSAFVLKYRLPIDFPGPAWIPLVDAQRAVRTIRNYADACDLDPERIGVIGFSAGGHLASTLETRPNAETGPSEDAIDELDARPSFGVLIYPVVSMDPEITHAGSRNNLLGDNPSPSDVTLYSNELQVTATTSPTFLGVSMGDTTVDPENSVRFSDALEAAGVAHELRQYQDGGHGFGIRNASGDNAAWPMQCASWLEDQGMIPAQ